MKKHVYCGCGHLSEPESALRQLCAAIRKRPQRMPRGTGEDLLRRGDGLAFPTAGRAQDFPLAILFRRIPGVNVTVSSYLSG